MDITLLSILQWSVYFISLYFSVFWLLVYLEKEQEEAKPSTHRNTTNPHVTITIPAFNEEHTIAKTIKSALALNYPKKYLQIIVVNDGSTDNTKQEAQKYTSHESVQLINKPNQGKGAALNTALDHAKGDYFVCLDADSEVHPDALTHILNDFNDPDVACAIPVMKIKNDKELNLLEKLQWYEYLVNVFFKKIMAKLDCVHVAPGPFSVYRRDVLEAVGRFSTTNMTEDLEMTVRLQEHNYKIVQNMVAEVYTNAMPTIKTYLRQRNRWFKGGVLTAVEYRRMLFNKQFGDFGIMQLPILILSGVISLILVGSVLYQIIEPIISQLIQMGLVNFDFLTFIRTFTFDTSLLDLSAASITLLAVMFTLSISILRLATYYTNEKTFEYNPLIVATYLIFYFFLLAATWAVVTKDLAQNKIQKW